MKNTSSLLTALSLSWVALVSTPPSAGAKGSVPEEEVTLTIKPDRTALSRSGPREIILEVEVAARAEQDHHTPKNLSVVLDRSGSMEGAKIEKARQAACVALDRLEAGDIFSLVVYDSTAEVIIAPERAGSRDHREELKARINRVRTRGGTALYAGVQLGAEQVRKFLEKERVNRVILLSDGLANVGPQKPGDLAELGGKLAHEGLGVSTVGVGDDFNEDLMTTLAEASHANYYYVQDAEKLPKIFADELGASATRVAGDVRIRIEVPAGVRVRGVLGHPEIHCDDRRAEIVLPELFGAERRLYHLQCRLEETTAENVDLAKVELAYQDNASHPHQTAAQTAQVRMTDDAQVAEKSVQDEVVRRIHVVDNRLDKEAAVKLADSGQAKEAAALLKQRILGNSSAPASQQMSNWQEENKRLEQLADELSSQGNLSKATRKNAQYDNYKDKNQKQ